MKNAYLEIIKQPSSWFMQKIIIQINKTKLPESLGMTINNKL